LEEDEDGFTVFFPDIPEALTSGTTREEALDMALDALITALDFYFEAGRRVPLPRPVPEGADAIELSASIAARISADS